MPDHHPYKTFSGRQCARYVASPQTAEIVNLAIHLGRPLLVEGEAGCGKTRLASAVADELQLAGDLIAMTVKSTSQAKDLLYRFDALRRLQDAQDPKNRDARCVYPYIELEPLGHAIQRGKPCVVLIDEIDKADIEFPNDLLQELDRMEFYVYELNRTIKAAQRPIMMITSNNEKELPDAFLRRCFFHYIRFPDEETMRAIIDSHFPGIKTRLVNEALQIFYDMRKAPGLKKKPSTSELLDWLKLLLADDVDPETLKQRDPTKLIPPMHGALLKNEADVMLFERLAFLARRESRGG